MIKFLSATPFPQCHFRYFPKVFYPIPWLDSLQFPIFIEKLQFSHQLHQHQKNKKDKKTNYDKVAFHYPPVPGALFTVSLKSIAQYPGSTVSNSPYSLRNRNFRVASTTTQKRQKLQLMIKLLSTNPLSPTLFLMFIQRLSPNPLSWQSPTSHIH